MTTKYRIRAHAQADTHLKALIQWLDWLATNPTLGKLRDDIKQGYFCFPEGMHLIFYIVKNNQIEIIGIPHQRMDIVEYMA